MSGTIHHRSQRHAKCGLDFGAKFKHNKHYGGSHGPFAKKMAHKELRAEDRKIKHNTEGTVNEYRTEICWR
jgi:hypothetical protein